MQAVALQRPAAYIQHLKLGLAFLLVFFSSFCFIGLLIVNLDKLYKSYIKFLQTQNHQI